MGQFLYVGCQVGAEQVCKRQMALAHEELRLAFSRPGFLTFKRSEGEVAATFEPRCAFARIWGASCGRAEGTLEARVEQFWQHFARQAPAARHLHVWARTDRLQRGEDGGPSSLDEALAALTPGAGERGIEVDRPARAGHAVVDCVVVEPDQWWVGWREPASPPSRWVGGRPPLEEPPTMVSRTYLKMNEALLWSRLPLRPGEVFAEIGSAPGGACQAVLEHGLDVIGIDPADMDPIVASHPRFTHIRRRGVEVRRRDLAAARWLSVDSNVSPGESLDTVEALHADHVRFDGMLLTLKMPDWKLADRIEDYLSRIRSWGYELVKPRHLYHNRQELCVLAVRRRSILRKPRGKA